MTIDHAIEILKNKKKEYDEMSDACEKIIEELKKREPIKPINMANASYLCPKCDDIKAIDPKDKFCNECGQKIDWGDINDRA